MTRETRIAMLVGLLFIIMFGLVVSELTGGGASSAAIRPRGEKALAVRYPPSLQVERPAGEAPGRTEAARGDASGSSLQLAHHAPDACSFVEVRVVPRPRNEGTEGDGSREAVSGGPRIDETIRDTSPSPPPVLPAPPAAPGKKYMVKAKDTLIKIARAEYGRENEKQYVLIQQANHLAAGAMLAVGQELVIPPLPGTLLAPLTPSRAPASAPPAAPPAPSYTVMGLEDLRRTFGPSPAPAPAPSPVSDARTPVSDSRTPVADARTPDASKRYYVIRRGDSLGRIAREKMKDDSQASIRRLYDANKGRLRDPDNLPVGVRLEIPA